jgi:ribonuclease Z
MKPIYHPRLVNGLAGDPVLYIDFLYIRRAVLFDCGNLLRLVPRQLLRVSDIFITHTHVDHFIGFDQILRLLLGREKILTLYGPAGLIDSIHHKLQAYTWNLVQNYSNHFEIRVRETDGSVIRKTSFICAQGFTKEAEYEEKPFDGILLSEPSFYIKAKLLDHGIPALGYVLVEHEHLGINKDRLKERSLQTGPWLSKVKEMIRKGEAKNKIIAAPCDRGTYQMTLGEIEANLIIRSPGQRIAYVVDCSYSKSNREKIIALAKGVDYFFCEAAFLEEDKIQASKTRHLTARQAGELATAAGVDRLIPFHFSPRYQGKHKSLLVEADRFFQGK